MNTNKLNIISFYKFVPINKPKKIKSSLEDFIKDKILRGTILLANEGINASIAGSENDLEYLVKQIKVLLKDNDFNIKKNIVEFLPFNKMKVRVKKEIVSPYISVEKDQARVSVRIKDSLKDLRRNDLIKKINLELNTKLGFDKSEYKLAGVLILFNNLLQSLFKSQILTLGIVMLGISAMFFVLFRNVTLSLIGVVPNFIAAFFILGIIGLMGIPLDMMTITIAAITIGIAVDNSIHYIYRFKEEFKKINSYKRTLDRCHSTVGIAILNTSITIVFGFSILVLSNFIPTIYFGFFTGVAMLLAMISVLTLLPKLILIVKPFGNV